MRWRYKILSRIWFFSLSNAAWYFDFSSWYWFLRLSLRSSLFVDLWYLLLRALILFLLRVNSSVHHVTDLYLVGFFVAHRVVKDLLHDDIRASWNRSISLSVWFVFLTCDAKALSRFAYSSCPVRKFIATIRLRLLSNFFRFSYCSMGQQPLAARRPAELLSLCLPGPEAGRGVTGRMAGGCFVGCVVVPGSWRGKRSRRSVASAWREGERSAQEGTKAFVRCFKMLAVPLCGCRAVRQGKRGLSS